jgi:anti-sigma factor RsiW
MLATVWPATAASVPQSGVMVNRSVFTDRQLQDYVDGRLRERDRAAVAAYLLAHPHVAAEVEAVRRQSEALRALGHEILDEPLPERLREVLRRGPASSSAGRRPARERPNSRHRSRLLETAAAILLLLTAGALGWFAHGALRPAPSPADALLADMTDAYALYGAGNYPVVFPPERANEFLTWIGRSFEREVPPPNLAELGYRYRGGRLLPNAGAYIGLFHFEHPQNARLAVFFWNNGGAPGVVPSLPDRNGIAARFWDTDGLSFAVIGDRANRDLQAAADSVFQFYEHALDGR